MKIAIILVDYNSHEHTKECLDSLEKANFKNIDVSVVIVDNASVPKLQVSETKYKNFSLTIIHSEKNTGFTGGNNQGIRHALEQVQAEYVLLLNNDTYVDPDFLQELLSCAQKGKNVGVITPMIYFAKGYEFHKDSYDESEKGKVIWFAGGSIDWKNMYAFHRGVDQVDRGQFHWPTLDAKREELNTAVKSKKLTVPYISSKKMDFATGCCMFIPSSVIEKVGMFDDAYFLYWEDVDLSYRIQKAGYDLLFCPDAVIWHKNAGSTGGSGSSFHVKFQERNRLRFAMKYASWRTKFAVWRAWILTSSSSSTIKS